MIDLGRVVLLELRLFWVELPTNEGVHFVFNHSQGLFSPLIEVGGQDVDVLVEGWALEDVCHQVSEVVVEIEQSLRELLVVLLTKDLE